MDAEGKALPEVAARDIEFWLMAEDERFEVVHGRMPSLNTQRNAVVALNGFFKFCERMDYVVRNPMSKIEAPRPKRRQIDYLTEAEERAMWNALRSPQERILFSFAIYTGMRVGEMVALKNSHVDLEGGTIRIRTSKTEAGIRTIYIDPALMPHLRAWKQYQGSIGRQQPRDWFFVTASGKAWSEQQAWMTIKRIGKRAGVRTDQVGKDDDNQSGVTLHCLRRTWATRALAAGKSIKAISAWLGHSSTTVTEQAYASYTADQMRREILDF